jgi:hypothetical protein
MIVPEQLLSQYRKLKSAAAKDLLDTKVTKTILEMALHAKEMLGSLKRLQFASQVTNKHYFGFEGKMSSRPINQGLYADTSGEIQKLLNLFDHNFYQASDEQIVRATYTIAYSVFAANDVYGVGRKASATFFEILIGHIVSRIVGMSPRKKVQIPESGADLPTDYVFDPGPKSRKVHVPIKTSTRERGVQAWVHQLVLDRIFGMGVFRGIFVVSSETRYNTMTGAVTEICVPKQLQMFQSRVAEISRVYYLDPPQVYLALSTAFPRVEVRSFGTLVGDLPALLQT